MTRILTIVALLALGLPQPPGPRRQRPPHPRARRRRPRRMRIRICDPNDAQPDFFVSTIPTTLRLPKNRLAFRLTHRFARSLGQGDFGELFEDFFGFDSGALMGARPELRRASRRTASACIARPIARSSSPASTKCSINETRPLGVGHRGNVDGTNNFRDSYSPGVRLVLSRELGESRRALRGSRPM